jgi:hypothetical protein
LNGSVESAFPTTASMRATAAARKDARDHRAQQDRQWVAG